MSVKFIELINNVYSTGKKLESEDFIVKELVLNNGFMVFSKNEQTFIIGVNKEVVNEFNHHPSSQVWNGLGGFENLATLVKR